MKNPFVRRRTPLVRPLARGDVTTIDAVFDGLTAEQRWLRFHVAMPRLPLSTKRRLADVDGRNRVALVVELSGRPVGIGRYARVSGTQAEVALAVVATHTGRGLGTLLVNALVRHASLAGIEEFVFETTRNNSVALNLARSQGAHLVLTSGGVHGSLAIGPRPTQTETDRGSRGGAQVPPGHRPTGRAA